MKLSWGDVFRARQVVEEDDVSALVDGARTTYTRVGDVYDAVVWRLARAPQSGTLIRDGYWILKTPEWRIPGVPVITVLYTFNDDQVVIEGIRFSSDGSGS